MQFAGMRITKNRAIARFFVVLLCLLYFVGTSLKLALAFELIAARASWGNKKVVAFYNYNFFYLKCLLTVEGTGKCLR
jgi:hypothetical protein